MPNITIDPVEVLTGEQAATPGAPEGRRLRGRYNNTRLAEAANLMKRVFAGSRRAMVELEENMSTSDFSNLFGAVLDRRLLTSYASAPQVWQQFATRRVVRDFRPASLIDILGGRAILPEVPELTEYPARPVTEQPYSIRVAKRGARIGLSWETFVNDDLDAFRTLPDRLAQAARNTEDYIGTGLLEAGGVPNPAFFNSGNENVLFANPQLTLESLTDALTQLSDTRDSEGLPIVISGTVLVVPPALEIPARQILNATELRFTNDEGRTMITQNFIAQAVTLVVNRWLTSSTGWYLVPSPTMADRFSIAVGFLRGYEVPDLRIKSDGGQRAGGGDVPPEEGSFDIDDVQYRVRHVTGGATADPKGTLASAGSGES